MTEILIDNLIDEYKEGRKKLHHMKKPLNDKVLQDKEDKKQINKMISSMSFSLDWMEKGHRPGNLRGIDRRSAYQRRALIDMDLFPSLDIQPKERELTDDEKEAIIQILADLSHRERQCFLLHMAHGLTYSEIQKELDIGRSTVQKYIERAKDKISKKVCRANVVQSRIEDERALM